MTKLTVAIFSCFLHLNIAYASQWTTIHKWDAYELLFDAESLTIDKQLKNVWTKIVLSKPKLLYPDTFRGETFDTTIEDITFNCRMKEMKINQTVLFLGSVSLNTLQPAVRWFRPIPDSLHDYALKHVCKI